MAQKEKKAEVKGKKIDDLKDVRAQLQGEDKVEILIPSTETEHEDVKLGINGYVYQIQRDKWVLVPKSVVELLQNNVQPHYRQEKGDEGMKLIKTASLRISFQMRLPVRDPAPAPEEE